MKRTLAFLGVVLACSSGFPNKTPRKFITLTKKSGDPGSPTNRLPIQFTTGSPIVYRLEMHNPDGALDDGFDGWVRLSAKPGTVLPAERNVHMVGGVADNVTVTVVAAFGDVRVWAEDLGYVPAPKGQMSQCSNGEDDNGDYVRDFPADPGCFAADDDDESAATLAAGASDIIYFVRPRVADVRGVATSDGTATAFPFEQVRIDTGYDSDKRAFAYDVVVTRVASDGFNVTDVQDQNVRGFASIFAFTFSPPQRLAICDRLKALSGTAVDFFGFTEISFPTWSVEYYNPSKPARPCLVPEPRVLAAQDLIDPAVMFRYESALVRVQTGGSVNVHIGRHFGPKPVPFTGPPAMPVFTFADDTSSCDLNGSGKVEFALPEEDNCVKQCSADPECSEYTNFLAQSNFNLVVASIAPTVTSKAQVNASASPGFDPVLAKGKMIGAFTGTIRYFSGGQQFTIEARCGDDIIEDPKAQPLPSDKACIRPRPDLDLNEGTH